MSDNDIISDLNTIYNEEYSKINYIQMIKYWNSLSIIKSSLQELQDTEKEEIRENKEMTKEEQTKIKADKLINFIKNCLSKGMKLSNPIFQNIIINQIVAMPGITNSKRECIKDVLKFYISENVLQEILKDFFINLYIKLDIYKDFSVIELIEICKNNNKIDEMNNFIIDVINDKRVENNISDIVNFYLDHCKQKNAKNVEKVINTALELEYIKNKYSITIDNIIHKYTGEYVFKKIDNMLLKYNIFFREQIINNNEETILNIFEKYINEISDLYNIIRKFIPYNEIKTINHFIIKASQRQMGIDIIYNTIYSCCLNKKVQIGSKNLKQLIKIINDSENQKKKESQKILYGMYVSDYLFKKHQSQRDKAITVPTDNSPEFIELLNEVLGKEKSNKIKKIEDLTIREIKTLFNNLMNIKFNQTKRGVDGNNLKAGPFLEIIISLAENSGIDENTKIGDLYDGLYNKKKQKKIQQKLKKGKELTEIETFQNKLNNFCYAEIKANTEIKDLKDFITKVLKLKKEDFGKKGFKTFYVEFPGHAVTLVIDTSKPLNQFLEDNKKEIKDMVMFDSSHGIKQMINNNLLKFSNQTLADIINKIPVQEQIYQENGTCWGNTICTNSNFLNEYKNYNQIVDVSSIKQNSESIVTFKPQEGVQEGIINATNNSFMKYITRITQEEDYKKSYSGFLWTTTIESDIEDTKLFQKKFEVFKAQKKHLKELENRLNELERKLTELEKVKKEDTEQKQEEYKKNAEKLKKDIERLDNIPRFIVTEKPIISILGNGNNITYDTLKIINELKNKAKKLSKTLLEEKEKVVIIKT